MNTTLQPRHRVGWIGHSTLAAERRGDPDAMRHSPQQWIAALFTRSNMRPHHAHGRVVRAAERADPARHC